MGLPVIGGRHVVVTVRGPLGGQVLIEAAAQGNVHKLHPPADAQDGQIPVNGLTQQFPLHPVPGGAQLPAHRKDLLAVEGWGHVVAAGEENAAASLQQPPDVRAILRQGQHHPQPAGLGDGVHIPRQHPQAVPPGVHQGDNADDRLFHGSRLLLS